MILSLVGILYLSLKTRQLGIHLTGRPKFHPFQAECPTCKVKILATLSCIWPDLPCVVTVNLHKAKRVWEVETDKNTSFLASWKQIALL